MKTSFIFLVLTALLMSSAVWADCIFKQPQEKTILVNECSVIFPDLEPKLAAYVERYPLKFAPNLREKQTKEARKVAQSYRGALIEEIGHSKRVTKYFLASNDANVCAKFPVGVRVTAKVGLACCDSSGRPPCYLGFRNYIEVGSVRSVFDKPGEGVTVIREYPGSENFSPEIKKTLIESGEMNIPPPCPEGTLEVKGFCRNQEQ